LFKRSGTTTELTWGETASVNVTFMKKRDNKVAVSPSRRMNCYIAVNKELPPDGETVMTKIDDENGCRNEQKLKRRGNLWYFPDESMYVYYRPTHWKHEAI